MNGIVGMANILLRDCETPQQVGRVESIITCSDQLLGILNDILDISKIEAGKLVLEQRPLALEQVIHNACTVISDRALAKGVSLKVHASHLPTGLCGDAGRLQQALLNLLSNAVKFTNRGHVTLRVRTQTESEDAVLVRFDVEDSGIGMETDVMARLFKTFEQGDNSTTRRYGGTGLGLSLTRELAAMMGGEVGVTSAPGHGSTFWFTANLARSAAESAESGLFYTDAEALIRVRYRGARVLVVDDEAINLRVLSIQLEAVGLVVDTAANGTEAVARATAGSYAAILLDVQMPQMDGLEATRRNRALPGHAQTPIIAVTADAFNDGHARCLEAGMNAVLVKPFEAKTMFQRLWSELAATPPTTPAH